MENTSSFQENDFMMWKKIISTLKISDHITFFNNLPKLPKVAVDKIVNTRGKWVQENQARLPEEPPFFEICGEKYEN